MKLALTKNGEYIEPHLAQVGIVYYCPKCLKPVTLKRGKKIAAHFAHCAKINRIAESQQHRYAKKLLKMKVSRAGYVVKEEQSIGAERRSDLLIQLENNKCLAIEYQKSHIQSDHLFERIESYKRACITQWWIRGSEGCLPHKRAEKNCMYYKYHPQFGLYCWMLDHKKQALVFQYDLSVHPMNHQIVKGRQFVYPIEEGLPTFSRLYYYHSLFQKGKDKQYNNERLYFLAKRNKEHFCRYFRQSHRLIDRHFAKKLYERREVIEDVPLTCFLPPFYLPLSSYSLVYWRYFYKTQDKRFKDVLKHYKWYAMPFMNKKEITSIFLRKYVKK
ncbi:competence protein CoiA family protein [Atopobacter phocae]|uniref:competence protein CoiA family protein n=1 Tax=Atopobacter phocae TaxID=136492 RepID=UPI0004727864|nr:competence protein CoiA family protein [Atopobacter phocae]